MLCASRVPRFKISASPGGQVTFNLTAANGEIILTREQYASKESAKSAIAAVKSNAPMDERYVRREASNGHLYFVLRARNSEIVGTSEMYKSAALREGGIAAVKANAPLAATEG